LESAARNLRQVTDYQLHSLITLFNAGLRKQVSYAGDMYPVLSGDMKLLPNKATALLQGPDQMFPSRSMRKLNPYIKGFLEIRALRT
jgi:hypothetical protein